MGQKVNLNAYFERIGFAGSIAPTLATLELIHALHPAAIPFENLDPIMNVPVALDQPSLENKMLHGRRGGFCFEQNTLLLRVLRDLDFGVKPYVARSLWGHSEDADRPLSHMVLVVDIAGTSYLVDVGFGGATLTTPLKLRSDLEQETPNEPCRVMPVGTGFRLDIKLADEWSPVYRFEPVEPTETELAQLCDTIAADHHARQLLIVSRAEPGKRTNLNRARLTIHRIGVERERRTLQSLGEIRSVLEDDFGITLPPAELLDPRLEKMIVADGGTVDI